MSISAGRSALAGVRGRCNSSHSRGVRGGLLLLACCRATSEDNFFEEKELPARARRESLFLEDDRMPLKLSLLSPVNCLVIRAFVDPLPDSPTRKGEEAACSTELNCRTSEAPGTSCFPAVRERHVELCSDASTSLPMQRRGSTKNKNGEVLSLFVPEFRDDGLVLCARTEWGIIRVRLVQKVFGVLCRADDDTNHLPRPKGRDGSRWRGALAKALCKSDALHIRARGEKPNMWGRTG